MTIHELTTAQLAKIRRYRYDHIIDAGFLAICERVPGESWFIATVYHEWFLTDYVRGEGSPS